MFRRTMLTKIVCVAVVAGLAPAEALSSRGALVGDFLNDSTVTVVSADWGESSSSIRGSAIILDLRASLCLRNSGQRRIRGISLIVLAAAAVPGGTGFVVRPGLNVAQGDRFKLRIELRLIRPMHVADSIPVKVRVDGVLFDDLRFHGPDRLSLRPLLTARELEARRDRDNFKRLFKNTGVTGLQREILASLSDLSRSSRAGWQQVHGRATNREPAAASQRVLRRSPETERLVEIYRSNGMQALLEELTTF